MSKRLVIALGGNALGKTPQEQLELVKGTASTIVDLVEEGYDVVIGHGNGPQVGMVNLAFEYSANNGGGTPAMPFPECGAMTQGYIGYHLQQAVERELARRGINKPCAAVVTQVVVDRSDSAFQNPTKPVGMFYTAEQARDIAERTGYTFVEDAGRGYRRVVPSPIPVKIVELPIVEQLVGLHSVVITVGGGGIPVVEKGPGAYEGVAAVLMNEVKNVFATSAKGKMAAALVMKQLKDMKNRFDYNSIGGAPILGSSKPVFKAHGDAKARTIVNAIGLSKSYVEAKAIDEISSSLK